MTLVHGTGILWDGKGILLMGPSGSGKSDLALRLMTHGAILIGDDYVEVSQNDKGRAVMTAPTNIAGKIEVRNVGILTVPFRARAEIDLVLALVVRGEIDCLERLPEPKTISLEAVNMPCVDFYAFEASAPEKLRAALSILSR